MSESHVHVTVGFPFSEILIGHLVCLSSFAVCLLTSTLGISGQAAKRPQVCLFWQSCGKSAVLQLCGSKWEQWSQILMEDSCISRGLQPTRDSPKLLCIFFLCVFAPEHSFDGIHTGDILKHSVLSQLERPAPCTYLAEFDKMFSYLNKARNMICLHRRKSRLIAHPRFCHSWDTQVYRISTTLGYRVICSGFNDHAESKLMTHDGEIHFGADWKHLGWDRWFKGTGESVNPGLIPCFIRGIIFASYLA